MLTAGLSSAAIAALNHLIRSESWASERLRSLAGQSFLIEAQPLLRLGFSLTSQGELAGLPEGTDPIVRFSLPAHAVVDLLVDRPRFMRAVRITGPADSAEVLGFVFRNLRWDAEADISAIFGDILGRRITRMLMLFGEATLQLGQNTLANAHEYLVEESALILSRTEHDRFRRDNQELRDAVARLEKRVNLL